MKSAFGLLLDEGEAILRQKARRAVSFHFDWDGTEGPCAWQCWTGMKFLDKPSTYMGASGEEALRRLVEALRGT